MILACYPATGKSYAAHTLDNVKEYRYDYPNKELLKPELNDEEKAQLLEYEISRAKEIISLNNSNEFVVMQPDFRLLEGLDHLKQEYTIVIPDYHIEGMKEFYEERYLKRGVLSNNFISRFVDGWVDMMEKLEANPNKKIYLAKDKYVSDIIKELKK